VRAWQRGRAFNRRKASSRAAGFEPQTLHSGSNSGFVKGRATFREALEVGVGMWEWTRHIALHQVALIVP